MAVHDCLVQLPMDCQTTQHICNLNQPQMKFAETCLDESQTVSKQRVKIHIWLFADPVCRATFKQNPGHLVLHANGNYT